MSSKSDKALVNATAEILKESYEKQINEHAKKVAIAFKEWQDENTEGKIWENYDGHDTWYNGFTKEVIGTKDLFERFLKQVKL